jgi:hypothetical protein
MAESPALIDRDNDHPLLKSATASVSVRPEVGRTQVQQQENQLASLREMLFRISGAILEMRRRDDILVVSGPSEGVEAKVGRGETWRGS